MRIYYVINIGRNKMAVIDLDKIRKERKIKKELKGDDDYFQQETKNSKYFKPANMEDLIKSISQNRYGWCVKLKTITFNLNWDEILMGLVIPNRTMYFKYLELSDNLVGLVSESSYKDALNIYKKVISISRIDKPETPKKMNWFRKTYNKLIIRSRLKKYNFQNIGLNQKYNGGLLPEILFNYFKANSIFIMNFIDKLFWSDDFTELDSEFEYSLKLIHDSCLIYVNMQDENWLHLGFLHWCRLIRTNLMEI